MSLHRTSTQPILDNANVWGRLQRIVYKGDGDDTNPIKGLLIIDLTTPIISIGRSPNCTVVVDDKRLSGKHSVIQKQIATDSISPEKTQLVITLTDTSTNGTYLNLQNNGIKKIAKGPKVPIKAGDQIWVLTEERSSKKEAIGWKLVVGVQTNSTDKDDKAKEDKAIGDKAKQVKDTAAKAITNKANDTLANSLKQQITCSFCLQIMHMPVSIQPCNHRLCAGCLTHLLKSKKDQCIQCRKTIVTAVKDAVFHSIIQDYLKSHPQDKKDKDVIAQLDKDNIITTHDVFDVQAYLHPSAKKAIATKPDRPTRTTRIATGLARTSSDISASSSQDQAPPAATRTSRAKKPPKVLATPAARALRCQQCVASRAGFQCEPTQPHANCFTCHKFIAIRQDPTGTKHRQSCILCTNYFCNLYLPSCLPRAANFLTIIRDKMMASYVNADSCRNNKTQFEALRDYLKSKGLTSKDMSQHMLAAMARGSFSYIFDRKVMQVPPAIVKDVPLTGQQAVCQNCWADLWFQIILSYRLEITGSMVDAIRNRPTCYWGVNCRTMKHDENHARRYNHMVFQTKF